MIQRWLGLLHQRSWLNLFVSRDHWNKYEEAQRASPRPKAEYLIWHDIFWSPGSLSLALPPSLARSAFKSTQRFGSHTLELSAAESRPKGIWGQGEGETGRGRDHYMREDMSLSFVHLSVPFIFSCFWSDYVINSKIFLL